MRRGRWDIEKVVQERLANVKRRGLASESNATEALTLQWVLGVVKADSGNGQHPLAATDEGDHGWSSEPEAESLFLWWVGQQVLSGQWEADSVADAPIGGLRSAFHAGWRLANDVNRRGIPFTPEAGE